MKSMKYFQAIALLLFASVFFTNCSNDDDSSSGVEGTAQFEITDGPIDDANVKGVFITIAAVKVDGKEISGFTKQTIDLMAYQQGNTKMLGTTNLETGNYEEVTLVLDYEADANGNSPGTYVLTTDNVKHDLQTSASAEHEININTGDFDVDEGSTTNVVIDFDLRKSIRYEDSPQAGDQYDFVGEADLRSALRVVAKDETGKVTGNVSDNLSLAGDKIVVYAYEKGEFNKETEIEGDEGEVLFKNAVTSAVVSDQGNYTLAFLEAGDYELHFIGYEDANNDGQMEVKGELDLNLLANIGLDLNDLEVGVGVNVSISVLVLGLLP